MEESLSQVSPNALQNPEVFAAALLCALLLAGAVGFLLLRGTAPPGLRRTLWAAGGLFLLCPFAQALLTTAFSCLQEGWPPERLLWGPIWYPPLGGLAAAGAALLWLWFRRQLASEEGPEPPDGRAPK